MGDTLIWEFSLEQDFTRSNDVCIGMFYNNDCSCGEPSDLGILPIATVIEWFWAVHDHAAASHGSRTAKRELSGFYQVDLMPMHFLADMTYPSEWLEASAGGL